MALFKKYDTNNDEKLNFDEFVLGCYSFLKASRREKNVNARCENNAECAVATSAADQALADDEEEEALPDEIAELPAGEQQSAIKKMAFSMLAVGTFMVLMFAGKYKICRHRLS